MPEQEAGAVQQGQGTDAGEAPSTWNTVLRVVQVCRDTKLPDLDSECRVLLATYTFFSE